MIGFSPPIFTKTEAYGKLDECELALSRKLKASRVRASKVNAMYFLKNFLAIHFFLTDLQLLVYEHNILVDRADALFLNLVHVSEPISY